MTGSREGRASLSRARILAVDDHSPNLLALEATLGDLGEVVKVQSGEEALLRLLREDFALILLDVQMPGMDGFETARLIKERERSRFIPIVFLTARSRDASHVFRGYAQGAVDYVLKPFAPEILRSKVAVFVELFLKEQQLKRQEALLRQRERETLERESAYRYRVLANAMPLCVFFADAEGRLRQGNRAWCELSGLPADGVEDLWRSEVVHPEDREGAYAAWCHSVLTGESFEVQFRMRRQEDGAFRWFLGRAVPERNGQGLITGWIITATDIDDPKRAGEALARANAAKDAFLAAASHELRTPLAAAKMQVQLAERKYGEEMGEGPRRALAGLNRQVDRMTKLVSDLLDVSRLLTGRLSLEEEEFDLVPLLRTACERLQMLTSEHSLLLDVPEWLPMWGDPGRIEQVVTNLVSNAVRYSPQGGTVRLRAWVEGGELALGVSDEGVGIPAEKLALIFERFGQAHGARYGGLGLGLTISQGIVSQHGGRIWAESSGIEGEGSTFQVRLPLHSSEADRELSS
ncbi:response regulator [Cystobacter fuscus]|uniref:sensor histidine kinase n=1 Tax=Cystobacter fuscus TaxID=43 RepID=UPI002B2F6B90|nr:response regulator [Cystobacter fuscus]